MQLTSRSKFSKTTKWHEPINRASAICSLWKIYKSSLTPNCRRNHVVTCTFTWKTHHWKSRRTKFWQRVLFVICTWATTLNPYYMNMHSFSASHTRVIFFHVYRKIPVISPPGYRLIYWYLETKIFIQLWASPPLRILAPSTFPCFLNIK